MSSVVADTTQDLVSVIIPSFNRYVYLLNALQSVQDQTYSNIEIIVINDCSTQSEYYTELQVVTSHYKIPVVVKHLPVNMRVLYNARSAQGLTRWEGIKVAKGKWIAFLDDDDYWYPNKLEVQMDKLRKSGLLMCTSNMDVTDTLKGYDNKAMKSNIESRNKHPINPTNLPEIFTHEFIMKHNYLANSTTVIHRSVVDKVGCFKINCCEDYDYWLRALKYTNCIFIKESLAYYDESHGDGVYYRS